MFPPKKTQKIIFKQCGNCGFPQLLGWMQRQRAMVLSHSEYLVRSPVQAALHSESRQKYKKKLIFLAWHDHETQGLQEHINIFYKFLSWMSFELKTVRFWWFFFFIFFMKMQNESGSRIGSIHQHCFLYTKDFVVFAIMYMVSAKYDANGLK